MQHEHTRIRIVRLRWRLHPPNGDIFKQIQHTHILPYLCFFILSYSLDNISSLHPACPCVFLPIFHGFLLFDYFYYNYVYASFPCALRLPSQYCGRMFTFAFLRVCLLLHFCLLLFPLFFHTLLSAHILHIHFLRTFSTSMFVGRNGHHASMHAH